MSMQTMGVHIKVKSIQKSFEFYTALGFEQVFCFGPDKEIKEDYSGYIFQVGDAKLEIANGHQAVKAEVFDSWVTSSKISLMIYVDSLVEILDRCNQAKIPIICNPRHYYWGTLEAVIKDPDGLVLVFIAPYSEAEASKYEVDNTYAIKQ